MKYCTVTHITPKALVIVVVPIRWVQDERVKNYETFTLEELKENKELKFAFFYSDGRGVDITSLEDVFFASNILYTLVNAGYLKADEAIKAFHNEPKATHAK